MQAPLASIGLVAGILAGISGGGSGWVGGALLLGSVVLITFIVIMPTNHKLLEPGRDLASAETRSLLDRWGVLHSLRTGLSMLAFGLFCWLASGA